MHGSPNLHPVPMTLFTGRRTGQPLPEPLRRELESFFSEEFSQVRVHVGLEAPAVGALAFTADSELYFAPGCYRPESRQGRRLLAHELAHVVQQREGRVPAPRTSGPCLLVDAELEAEAERAAEAFVRGERRVDTRRGRFSRESRAAGRILQATPVKLEDSSKTSWHGRGEYDKYLYDYKLIQKWMTTPSEFLPALRALDDELKRSLDVKKRLTNVLVRREQQYGINQYGVPMYTAVLDGPEFVAMNKRGVLPKDHVTPEHGEFTHRLHWYIVLFKMSKGFTKPTKDVCFKTPVELLKASPLKAYRPPKSGWPTLMGIQDGYETGTFSMWEALFDRRPGDGLYAIEEDWLSCPEMFTALLLPGGEPGNIAGYKKYREASQKKGAFYTMSAQLPNLSAEVTKRYRKRAGELKNEGGGSQSTWAEWYRAKKAGKYTSLGEEEVAVEVQPSYQYLEYDTKTGKKRSRNVLVRRS